MSVAAVTPRLQHRRVLPGFGLTLGVTLVYLSLVVLIPLGALALKARALDWQTFSRAAFDARALAAYRLSFGASLAAALLNGGLGLLVAWVLARYRFAGRALLDAAVDLPFALPTAVAGIALTTIYAPTGLLGQWLERAGVKVAFAPLGVVIALVFVGVPFVVRTVHPILLDFDMQLEEAAATFGAGRLRTIATVIFPALFPALLTGMALAFARALGEYGSVVFISGNMPLSTEIVPLVIVTKLEQYDYNGAAAVALVMLAASFALLLGINVLQARLRTAHARWGRA